MAWAPNGWHRHDLDRHGRRDLEVPGRRGVPRGDRSVVRAAAVLKLLAWVPLCLIALSCAGRPTVDDARLIQELDSPHWQIRASAADELGRRRAAHAAPRLGEALSDDSDEVRSAAVMSLGLIGAKSELDNIRQLLGEEENRQVKVLALYALANLAAGETGEALRADVELVTARLNDDSRRVKRAARRVLRILLGDDRAAPDSIEPQTLAKARNDRPLQTRWRFDRIEDKVALARDGECTLTRTIVVRGLEPTPVTRFRILLPPSFPEVESVLDANGVRLGFACVRQGDDRQLRFAVPPLGRDELATFTLTARSRRPLFVASADEALLVYSPAPIDAAVAALRVELSLADRELEALDRTNLAARDLDDVILRVGIPASSLTLPRPPPRLYTRGGDLAWAAGVAAAALAVLAAIILWLRRKFGPSSDRAILVAVLTTGAFLFLTPALVQDCLSYYALARSAVLDGDLNRVNEYAEMNQTQAYDPDTRGPLDQVIGVFFRAPALAAAHGLTLGLNAVSPTYAPNGFSFPYLFVAAVGDFLAVLFGCLACFSLVERRVGRPYALFAVLAVFACTYLQLIAYAWTGSSFQPSFFLFAVFLDYWDRTREGRSGAGWLGAGVLLGLLGATRMLNLGFVLLPLLDWMHTAATRYYDDDNRGLARHARHGALLAAGLSLGYLPQLVLGRLVDHRWFTDAYGVSTGRFEGLWEHLPGLLFARAPDRLDGLLTTMPIVALAIAGLVPLFRSDRRLGSLLTATLALQLFAIGAYQIYWGYFLYGTPYLLPSSPILCLALGSLTKSVHLRWPRWGPIALVSVAVAFAARMGWCTLRELGFVSTSEPIARSSDAELLHALLIPGRKFDVDVLTNSSEFGCLLRETVGALRAGDLGQLLGALFWVAVLVTATLLAYTIATQFGRLAARIPPRSLQRIAIPALALAGIALLSWMVSLGAKTDVDYRLLIEQSYAGQREIKVTRLAPGATYTLPVSFENPASIGLITFLEDAADVPQGTRVATIEVGGSGERAQFELLAGVNTADFSIDRPELKAERRHTAPLDKACFSFRVGDDSSHLYTAKAYCADFQLPNVESEFEITVTSTLEHGALAVAIVTLAERKLPRDPARRRWIAERW